MNSSYSRSIRGKDGFRLIPLLLTLLFLSSFTKTYATDYYWVGGSGLWSDINHWASSSGGAGGVFVESSHPDG